MGVVVDAPAALLTSVTEAIAAFAQHRFVVTDLDGDHTYALACQHPPATRHEG